MIRVIEFENDFSPEELARALLDAGFPADTSIGAIATNKVRDYDADENCRLDCSIDEDDAMERLGDKAILRAARDIVDDRDERAIEDGIRYVRSGELSLASAMFGRVFQGATLEAAERALRQ